MAFHHDATLERLLPIFSGDRAAGRAVFDEVSDWPALIIRAEQHGLGGVLHRAIERTGVALPEPLRRECDERRVIEGILGDHLRRTLDGVLDVLHTSGIRHAMLKGPLLADRIYDEPSLRRTTDIDLLVADRDVDRVVSTLARLGFVAGNDAKARWHRAHHHHIEVHRKPSDTVEIHFRAFTGFGGTIPSEPLLERAIEHVTTSGRATWVLSPEDEWVYLAAHAAGHLFERMSWLLDLGLFARCHSDLDASRLMSRARDYGVASAVAFAATTLTRLGMPSPYARARVTARHVIAENVRVRTLSATLSRPATQLGFIAFGALLSDSLPAATALIARSGSRIARRRASRYFPTWVPAHWAG